MSTEEFDDGQSKGNLGSAGAELQSVYVTAYGPDEIDTEKVSSLLAESDLGGVVKSHAYGSDFVTLVVEVDTKADEAAYELVIGRVGVALGPKWSVKANVEHHG